MPRITDQVVIEAPVEAVFDMVADERNEPLYNPRIARAHLEGREPVGAGSRFVIEPNGMGSRGAMSMTILEHDRPHLLHNVVTSSYLQVDGVLRFEERGDATLLSWDWRMELVGRWRVLTPLLRLVGPRWERRNWVGLKHLMESGAGATGPS